MAKNVGKIFEDDFKKSVPEYALLYRLPDPAQSFGGGNKLRFSRKNPFDYMLWDSKRHILYALELKTVSGKSISFEREKDDTGVIHYYQEKGLKEWDSFDGTVCGFVIQFRELEKTIFLDIKDFDKLINIISKKSFSFNDLSNNNIKYTIISQHKKISRYNYDIDNFLTNKSEVL